MLPAILFAAGPVSRILSPPVPLADARNRIGEKNGRVTVIPLGRALLRGSSDLPGSCDAPSRHVLAVPAVQGGIA